MKKPSRTKAKSVAPAPDFEIAAPVIKTEPAAPVAAEYRRSDTLQLYLNEIGQVKLLTAEEEVALAKRIKRGDKQARELMITANLRLVVKIARDYEGLGLPLLDLINEGNIGLMKGVERFDPKHGAKLSTYASWWIKQAVKRALANQSKTIRLPVHVVDKVTHIRRAEVKLREVFDREPTDEEVADHLGLNPRRIQQYRDASRSPVSLDAPLEVEESKSLSETIADSNAEAPFARILKENDNGMVRAALATLSERETKILSLRFGLEDGNQRTLEEIGEYFEVTRERVRQIQEEALHKLRVNIEKREQPDMDDEEQILVTA